MSEHRRRVYLQHMLDYSREAATLAQGQSRPDLDKDRLIYRLLLLPWKK